MEKDKKREQYYQELITRGDLPDGFNVSLTPIKFYPREKSSTEPYNMNLTLISADKPTDSFGAVFTKNSFPGAPVLVGRRMLGNASVQGVLINNRVANVCAPDGEKTALEITTALEKSLGFKPNTIFPSSTGIIGWSLPRDEIIAGFPELKKGMQSDNFFPAAKGIMTTDSFPKLRSVSIGDGKIVAIAKGAGMIEPNMATMLSFILTDIDIEREMLREILKEAVDLSFNRISIDSDQSTSDSVIMLSSKLKPSPSRDVIKEELVQLLKALSEDIVRNGEGTSHVLKVSINGFSDNGVAQSVAKAIVNSPLVKSAIFGNDPNVGRLISSVGDFCGNHGIEFKPDRVELSIGDELVFSNGAFLLDSEKEDRLYNYLKDAQLPVPSLGYPQHSKTVNIRLKCDGNGVAEVFGSDLSYEYVRENAEYRS